MHNLGLKCLLSKICTECATVKFLIGITIVSNQGWICNSVNNWIGFGNSVLSNLSRNISTVHNPDGICNGPKATRICKSARTGLDLNSAKPDLILNSAKIR